MTLLPTDCFSRERVSKKVGAICFHEAGAVVEKARYIPSFLYTDKERLHGEKNRSGLVAN